MSIKFKFEIEKTAEVIIYLAQRASYPTIMAIAKLLYFADKTSLEKYGRTITGDAYFAMPHGPVPSAAYNLMKEARDTDVCGFHVEHEKYVIPNVGREPNLDKLSKLEIKCLDQVIAIYGNLPVWQLREISHDEAWQKNWAIAQSKGVASSLIPVEDLVSTVDEDEGELLEYLKDTYKAEDSTE